MLDRYTLPQIELLRERHFARQCADDLRRFNAVHYAAAALFGGKSQASANRYLKTLTARRPAAESAPVEDHAAAERMLLQAGARLLPPA